jgi:pimeloyl-ACP methyl ester carboxylesterase
LTAERFDVGVEGGTLAVYRFGDPSRPAVLAVHGITSNSQCWRAVGRALSERASIIAPDLRGRGRSGELPGPYGITAHVHDLVAILDQLGLERVVAVGHSLGAYVVARLAAGHPDRVAAAILIDGGLTIPGTADADPDEFGERFLGPVLARLHERFPSQEAYRDWWRAHPALADKDVLPEDLIAYADHDLVGEPPELRSSVAYEAVRVDGAEVFGVGEAAHVMRVPATLLCAPRGLLDGPDPMQPFPLAQAWAKEVPHQREAILVPGTNHYTIVMGTSGASEVADAIAARTSDA